MLAVMLAMQLAGCGGGGGSGSVGSSGSVGISSASSTSSTAATVSAAAVPTAPNTAVDVVIRGSVGDGPVTGATVEVWSSGGQKLGSMKSDSTASFRSTLKAKGKDYPLLLKVSGGIDLVTGAAPDFRLLSVMRSPSDRQVNITPFSTLIVLVAERLPGGLNSGNVATAQQYVTGRLGFGLDTALIGDPIRSPVTEKTVANLVKSSEALGEMVRRSRDLVRATGRQINGNEVLQALAADLRDGFVDGLGASGTDATISAVANVVTGQVLVEAMSNKLKVGGVVATGVLDQAIRTTRPQVQSTQLTGSVRVTAGMLQQAEGALAAIQAVDNSAAAQGVVAGVASVPVNALPGKVAQVLPASSSASLNRALTLVANATSKQRNAVNLAVYSTTASTNIPATNSAPVITGVPAKSVTVNNGYMFQPGATDADGDTLTFSITNKPRWAVFNSATGRLNGTPAGTDAGTYGNIVISVSDGAASAVLPAFSIQVNAATGTTGSFTLNWTAPVARADGTPLSLADIDGYRIYYGKKPGAYNQNVNIADGRTLSATVKNIPAGGYYVVMTTYDVKGLESGYSREISKQAK
jgi:hypothetical protein